MAIPSISQGVKAWGAAIKEDLRVEPSEADQRWSNKDLEPTPPERRVYHWYNYLLYFIGTGFNNWSGGSSVIGVGLGWKAAIAITFVANIIAGMAVAANCKAAARYHIGFPAIARSVYGMWGSSYQVGVRAILAAVWYATQIYSGASYLGVMLTAVFGTHFTSIPNHVPASIGYTTQDFLCYFLVWLIYLPLLLRRPHQMRWLFAVACALSFPSILALFIYCMVQSGGRISLDDQFGSSSATLSTTSQRAWQVVYALTSTISNGSPYIESIPDMARWAHSPLSPIPTTLFTNSVFNPLSAVLGILGTSALQVAIGQTLWTPWDVMTYMLEQHTSTAGRFGVFCLAFTWLFQTLSQNVSSNMIPFGADTSMLWPRYINMTRGYLIVHFLAWVICPWKIYASAETFLDFMGAYGIFMGPAISIMLCEYYVFSRGNLFVPSLYDGRGATNKHYWYTGGWNIQAYIAYIVAVGLCFIGFVNKVGATVPQVGIELGYLGWFLTFSTGWIVYYVVVKVWPHQNVQYTKNLKWEELAATDYGVQGVLHGVPSYPSDEEERQESEEGGIKSS
ncbi:hypothetical protein SEUCBS139899_003937 [Sporothrix eucalyptigena]